MPYDPNFPADHALIEAPPFRGQFNGLKDLIDAIQTITAAQVDATNTLPAGEPAAVTLSVVGGTIQFTFSIPTGPQGSSGSDGGQGQQGIQGEPGLPGAPGEVSLQQLTYAISTTSSNSNNVATLGITVSDPPTQSEVQQIADKMDELIVMLRR
ncbi:hypothetical protein [Prosthecobacter sp.]|uniref:hypothetical protein n=1 Tax=Prosthecobacter sp. TaxID=1965333 RepID=UPI002ABA022C|nr:hypothetical protein [Prosthecobacter sp.]MDZ4405526.1 hypothetical protein [Prosthecobacter sp.]